MIERGDHMPLICLEGASAVGKMTTAKEIAKAPGVYVIPGAILLFERPKVESVFREASRAGIHTDSPLMKANNLQNIYSIRCFSFWEIYSLNEKKEILELIKKRIRIDIIKVVISLEGRIKYSIL
jgi:hypothetical protein